MYVDLSESEESHKMETSLDYPQVTADVRHSTRTMAAIGA
jgi:hypothetical protein